MKAILVSIDGLRADAVTAETTPNLVRIGQAGTHVTARTVMPCCTLPCHTSMFRGVDATRHGITTNTWQPMVRPIPSLIDTLDRHGYRCGAFFNWGELRDLFAPGSATHSVFVRDAHRPEGDDRVYAAFKDAADKLDFAFVYFGHTDEAGHAAGWMSEPYLSAAANADRWVGEIVARHPEAFVIIMSDHGGHDRTHGTELKEDMEIPLIVNRRVNLPESPMIYHIPSLFARELDFAPEREWESVA